MPITKANLNMNMVCRLFARAKLICVGDTGRIYQSGEDVYIHVEDHNDNMTFTVYHNVIGNAFVKKFLVKAPR